MFRLKVYPGISKGDILVIPVSDISVIYDSLTFDSQDTLIMKEERDGRVRVEKEGEGAQRDKVYI